MALGARHDDSPSDPLVNFAERHIAANDVRYVAWNVRQPDEDVPTLDGAPDDMSLQQASTLLVQASRWLEHLMGLVHRKDAERILWEGQQEVILLRVKCKYGGKLAKMSLEEYQLLERAMLKATAARAELAMIESAKRQLDQVKTAASRVVTAQTKSNPTIAS